MEIGEVIKPGERADLEIGAPKSAHGLPGLVTARVVILRDEDGKEQRVESALPRAREIKLTVRLALADIAAVVEDAV